MPTTALTIRAGTYDDIDMQLLTDATGIGIADTGVNLSAADHAELYVINSDTGGTSMFSSAGTQLTIMPGVGGTIRFTPNGTTDLPLRSDGSSNLFECYYWIFITSTKKYSIPDDFNFTIRVKP